MTPATNTQELAELRARAQRKLETGHRSSLTLVPSDAADLVSELQLHRAELEMQNEELREAQLMLLEVNQRYQHLYDDAPVAYVTLDQRGRIIEANRATATLLVTPRHSLLGVHFSRFLTSGDADRFHLHRWEVLSSGAGRSVEFDLERPDGSRLAVQMESTAVATSGGTECWSALLDIDEHERMLRDLEDRERQLSTLLETVADGVVRFDPSGSIDWVSATAADLLGCMRSELMGRRLDDFLSKLKQHTEPIDVSVRRMHDQAFVAVLRKR